MAAQVFVLKQDSTVPVLEALLRDSAGIALPITGATITFTMVDRLGNKKVDAEAVSIIDAPTGKVQYAWQAANTDARGLFRGEFHITYPDSSVQIVPQDASDPFLIIQIVPSHQ